MPKIAQSEQTSSNKTKKEASQQNDSEDRTRNKGITVPEQQHGDYYNIAIIIMWWLRKFASLQDSSDSYMTSGALGNQGDVINKWFWVTANCVFSISGWQSRDFSNSSQGHVPGLQPPNPLGRLQQQGDPNIDRKYCNPYYGAPSLHLFRPAVPQL